MVDAAVPEGLQVFPGGHLALDDDLEAFRLHPGGCAVRGQGPDVVALFFLVFSLLGHFLSPVGVDALAYGGALVFLVLVVVPFRDC